MGNLGRLVCAYCLLKDGMPFVPGSYMIEVNDYIEKSGLFFFFFFFIFLFFFYFFYFFFFFIFFFFFFFFLFYLFYFFFFKKLRKMGPTISTRK